ncbi:MAG: Hpt domain-containing protein [Alphaproteobacteria bacterium]|jgi:HPt (histidine-containing phosphotransfer) domain-containing protein|nr:Hpt domain-containing protein [Alphaproteobacteria bacterium]
MLLDDARISELADAVSVHKLDELLQIFWRDLPEQLQQLAAADNDNKILQVAKILHGLRGTAANLGLKGVHEFWADQTVSVERLAEFKTLAVETQAAWQAWQGRRLAL